MGEEGVELWGVQCLNVVKHGGRGGGEVSQSEAQHTIVTYPHYTIYHIG